MAKDRKKLQHIHSSVPDKQPKPEALEVGEIAVNNGVDELTQEDRSFLSIKNSNDKITRFSSDEQLIDWIEKKEVVPYKAYVRGAEGPSSTSGDTPTSDGYGSYGINESDLLNNKSNIIFKINQVAADNTIEHEKINGANDVYGQSVNPSTDGGLTGGAGFFVDMSRYAMQGANPSFSSITVTHQSNLSGTTNIRNGAGGETLNIETTNVKAKNNNWNEEIANKTSNVTNLTETIGTANTIITSNTETIGTNVSKITTNTETIGTNNTTISGNTVLNVSGTTTETKKGNVTETNLGDKTENTSGNSTVNVNGNYVGNTSGTTTETKIGNVVENHSGTTTENKKGVVTENNLSSKTETTTGQYTQNNQSDYTVNTSGNVVTSTSGTTTETKKGNVIETNLGDYNVNTSGKTNINTTSFNVSGETNISGNTTVTGNTNVSGNATISGNTNISGNTTTKGDNTVIGNNYVSGNTTIKGNTTISGETIIKNNLIVTGNTNVSGNTTTKGDNNVSGNTTVVGNSNVSGNTAIKGTATVDGATTLNGATTVNNNLTVTGNTNVSGNTAIKGTATVDGATTLNGATTVNNNLTVTGNTNVSGNTTVSGNSNVSGNTTVVGNSNVSGNTAIKGNTTISGETTVNNNLTVTGNTNISGNTTTKGTATVDGATTLNGATTINNNLTVTGNTNVSGNTTTKGDNNVSGNTTVVGNSNVSGNTTIKGNTTISGETTVKNNLTVTGNTNISGNTTTKGDNTVIGNSNVSGNTEIKGTTTLNGETTVKNNLTVTGNTNISGNTTVKGNTNISGNTEIKGTTTLDSATTINDNLTVTGNTNVSGNTTTKGDNNVSGNTTVVGNTNVSGNTAIKGIATVDGATTINNNLTVTGNTYVSGSTTVKENTYVSGNTEIKGTTTLNGETTVKNNLTVTGNTNVSGNTTVKGETKLDTVSANTISSNTISAVTISGTSIKVENIEVSSGGTIDIPVVSKEKNGLAPQTVTATTTVIGNQENEFVLTTTTGATPTWRKLPVNAFRNYYTSAMTQTANGSTVTLSAKTNHTDYTVTIPAATTSAAGVVKLASSTGTSTDNVVMTQSAVTKAIEDSFTAQDAMRYKGTLSSKSQFESLSNYSIGDTYKVSSEFTTTSGVKLEIGDMVIAQNSGSTFNVNDFNFIQSNLDPTQYVLTSRTISTASGLTGGGKLSSDVTVGLVATGTSGTYGPSTDVTGNDGETIKVPQITTDVYGRVTKVEERTYTSVDSNDNYYTTGLTVATAATTNSITVKGNNNVVKGTATLSAATTTAAGLMTSTDKSNLDTLKPLTGNVSTLSGITDTNVTNWNTAYNNNHTHSNKTTLDSITGSVGTMAYEDNSSYVPTSRTISTASGLTGGGKLSGDVTVGLVATGTSGTYYRVVTDSYGRVISGNTVDDNSWRGVLVDGLPFLDGSPSGIPLGLSGGSNVTLSTDQSGAVTINAVDTKYSAGTASQISAGTSTYDGVWSAANLKSGIESFGYTKNTGTVTKVSTASGITGGDITTSGTIGLVATGTSGTYGPSADVTGNNGNTIKVPQITTDVYGRVTKVEERTYTSVDTQPNADTWRPVKVNSSNFLTDKTDALDLVAGSNVTLTTGASGVVTISSTGGGTTGDGWRPVKVDGNSFLDGTTSSSSLNLSGGSNVTLTTGSNGLVTISSTDNNDWRPVKVDGSNFLTDSTTSLNLSGGSNVTLSTGSTGLVTISSNGAYLPLSGGTVTGDTKIKGQFKVTGDTTMNGGLTVDGGVSNVSVSGSNVNIKATNGNVKIDSYGQAHEVSLNGYVIHTDSYATTFDAQKYIHLSSSGHTTIKSTKADYGDSELFFDGNTISGSVKGYGGGQFFMDTTYTKLFADAELHLKGGLIDIDSYAETSQSGISGGTRMKFSGNTVTIQNFVEDSNTVSATSYLKLDSNVAELGANTAYPLTKVKLKNYANEITLVQNSMALKSNGNINIVSSTGGLKMSGDTIDLFNYKSHVDPDSHITSYSATSFLHLDENVASFGARNDRPQTEVSVSNWSSEMRFPSSGGILLTSNGNITLKTTGGSNCKINISGVTVHNSDVYVSGTVYQTSDAVIKENVTDVDYADASKANEIPIKSFIFKGDESKTKKYGVIAQDVEDVGLNNLVSINDDIRNVDYNSLLILKIAYLENKIKELEKRLDDKFPNNG